MEKKKDDDFTFEHLSAVVCGAAVGMGLGLGLGFFAHNTYINPYETVRMTVSKESIFLEQRGKSHHFIQQDQELIPFQEYVNKQKDQLEDTLRYIHRGD